MEALSLDNILGEQELETLFESPDEETQAPENNDDGVIEEANDETTEAVTSETLFDEEEVAEQPESVGSGKKEEVEERGSTVPAEDEGTSPANFYSSIANALAVDGIFPNLDEDTIKNATTAEGFSDLIEAEVMARLDDRQQRISKALENGVEPSDIKKYENTLNYISSITDAAIAEESEKGEQLRRNLIYQDFLNKGYTPAKAQKMTERTIDAGTDIEDAREALQSNREFFQGAYNTLLKEAQAKADYAKKERQKMADSLRTSMMKDKQLFGNIDISQKDREKAFEAISKPVYRDPETGEYLTAIQKYELEHRGEFLKYAGLMYTLTKGFTDFSSFTKGEVKKQTRKAMEELQRTLNTTKVHSDGSLRMVNSSKEDPDSWFDGNMKLAL